MVGGVLAMRPGGSQVWGQRSRGALPGPACRDGPPAAPSSSGPPPSSPPEDAPPAAGGCPRPSQAGAPHLYHGTQGA